MRSSPWGSSSPTIADWMSFFSIEIKPRLRTVNGGHMPFMENNALEQLGRVVGKEFDRHTADASCLSEGRMLRSRFLEPP